MAESEKFDRIRSATFGIGRKGYDKREVERFLNQLADWLESGGSDQVRADTFRRELEKIGERTSAILSAAHEAGEELRADAEGEAQQTLNAVREEAELKRADADTYSHDSRSSADGYSEKAHAAADAYAAKTRGEADDYAAAVRAEADRDADEIESQTRTRAREMVELAKSESERVISEGRKRRADIEAVITDLVGRRDAVLADIDRLTGQLRSAVGDRSEPRGGGAEPPARRPAAARSAASGSKAPPAARQPGSE